VSSKTELPPLGNDELASNFTLSDLYLRSSTFDRDHSDSTSSPQSLNISKDNCRTSVSESASNAVVGSESSVLSTAKAPSNYEGSIPSGESVTIHVGSSSSNATTNGSRLASRSISNSAQALGNVSVDATNGGDSKINGSSSSNSLGTGAWSGPQVSGGSTASDAVSRCFQLSSDGDRIPDTVTPALVAAASWRVVEQLYRRALGYDVERHDGHLLRDQLGQHLCRDNDRDVPSHCDGAPTQGQGIVKALRHSSRFSTTLMVE